MVTARQRPPEGQPTPNGRGGVHDQLLLSCSMILRVFNVTSVMEGAFVECFLASQCLGHS